MFRLEGHVLGSSRIGGDARLDASRVAFVLPVGLLANPYRHLALQLDVRLANESAWTGGVGSPTPLHLPPSVAGAWVKERGSIALSLTEDLPLGKTSTLPTTLLALQFEARYGGVR